MSQFQNLECIRIPPSSCSER